MRILLILMMLLTMNNIKAQNFENWNTLNISGNINDKFKIVLEGEQRYNHENKEIRYFHFDVGTKYKINNKLSIGAYYRELYEIKNSERVLEIRPHLDLFYNINENFKIRVRNEYQIKEKSENVFRYRIRPTYIKMFNDNIGFLIQTEPFFVRFDLIRNRFNPSLCIKIKKFTIEPGYMLESNNKNGWSNIHIMWVNTKIKF